MTLQEFIKRHPNLVDVERAGVEGIDLERLHNKIEQSRYLKSKVSFVYLSRNYNQILSGKFDDFPEAQKPQLDLWEQEQARKREEYRKTVLERIEHVKNLKLTTAQRLAMKTETGVYPEQLIDDLQFALTGNESGIKNAELFYNRTLEFLKTLVS